MKNLEGKLAAAEEELRQRRQVLEDVGERTAEAERLQKQVEAAEQSMSALARDLPVVEAKHLKAVTDYEGVRKELREAQEKCEKLRGQAQLYEERVAAMDAIEEELAKLNEQAANMREVVASIPDRQKELAELQSGIGKAEESRAVLATELSELGEAQSEAQKKLEETTKKIEEATGTYEAKKAQIEKLENAKIDVEARLKTLSDRLKTVGKFPPEAFDSLKVSVFAGGTARERVAEEAALADVERLTRESGFRLSRRVQRAFHAALKCSDISCLTVMAGVSGTGKSAFPDLYARAMGMYFLPISVEPRWDSPQDLFGFLNYMENRFEATPLGRALVQFNSSEFAAHCSKEMLADRVLMVLLDEMNLARVEYYFSELLSRLEMRRNADLSSEEDYRRICTEVFAGYAPEGDHPGCEPVRLYAGQNVLFVGTMNEDESTQSLSDKVIDRANVLYFGRPTHLEGRPQEVLPREGWHPISLACWLSWLREPATADLRTDKPIPQLLQNLNSILEQVQRPFGHRTYRAILSYIYNHPDTCADDAAWRRPLADQIAMRIMPKLRGLDLQEHGDAFNRAGSVIAELDDPALTNAFRQAQQSGESTYFNWRGLSWDD